MFLLHDLLELYVVVLFGRIILSWFPIGPGSSLAPVAHFLHAATEPVLAPVRRALPPMRMGGVGFDFSPVIVLIGIQVLAQILPA